MIFALICKDKPGSLELRLANRPAHLDYLDGLNARGVLKFAGPFIGGDGKPFGSLVAVEAESRAAAQAIAEADPYARAGLFDGVEINAWNWVFNAPDEKAETK